MRFLRIPAAFVFLTALTVGCGHQPLTTASSDTVVDVPAFNFQNGPDNPGMSGVFRIQGILLVFTTDPDRDLIAAHFQADDFFVCGGDFGLEVGDIQIVNNKDDIERAIGQLNDAPIFIYRLSDFLATAPMSPERCALFENDWLYKGTHSVRVNLNDRTDSGPGANSILWNGTGNVVDPAGDGFRYTEHQNGLGSPDNSSFRWINEDIKVHRTGKS